MRFKSLLSVTSAALIAVSVSATVYAMGSRPAAMPKAEPVPFATPAGIMIQPYGKTATDRYGVVQPEGLTVFADPTGLPLYVYDKDGAACTGECAADWTPALAPATAAGFGPWSVVAREDGAKQWALNGKPVFTYKKEDEARKQPAIYEPFTGGMIAKPLIVPEGWKVAYFDPGASMKLPVGILVQEVADAKGQVLVNDAGMTLYSFTGDAKQPLSDRWRPVNAPLIASTVGEFSVERRPDGTPQWAFRGKALYTYEGDVLRGEANGIGADPRVQVAALTQYFMPAEVAIHSTEGYGTILTTKDGMSIYTRDRLRYNPGGNNARDGNHRTVARGRALGTEVCDAVCLEQWKPLAAPADAQSRDHWQVVVRKDGTRQWAYRGYALYTYTSDKVAGDMKGNDLYEYVSRDKGMLRIADANTEAALFWRVGIP